MVHHSVVFHDITLVRKEIVIVFGGGDEVVAVPVLPMHEVSRNGERVVGGVGA